MTDAERARAYIGAGLTHQIELTPEQASEFRMHLSVMDKLSRRTKLWRKYNKVEDYKWYLEGTGRSSGRWWIGAGRVRPARWEVIQDLP